MMPMLVRTFIASVAGIASAAASDPASRVVLDQVVSDGYFHSTAAFVTDEETARAWVEAAVQNGGVGDDYRFETFRAKVPDVYYPEAGREHRSLRAALPARAQEGRYRLRVRDEHPPRRGAQRQSAAVEAPAQPRRSRPAV
jgi:hypothetical protein